MSDRPVLEIDGALEPRGVRAALVWGLGLPSCSPSSGPSESLAALLSKVSKAGEAFLAPERKASVRNMLRYGAYRPAGRSKPSSEYLLGSALSGSFPYVNGPVDVNNEVSLQWGYPASVFDLARTGLRLQLSRGRSGESYVFNASGQEIDLEDLIVVRRWTGEAWEACGNPVKDAMSTKVFESARDVAAVVYAPMAEPAADLEACAVRFAQLLSSVCGAAQTGVEIL